MVGKSSHNQEASIFQEYLYKSHDINPLLAMLSLVREVERFYVVSAIVGLIASSGTRSEGLY